MATIAIYYGGTTSSNHGTDITDDVVIADARFTQKAQGAIGEGSFRVKDTRGGPYGPGYFVIGKEIRVLVDGTRVWGGYVMSVTREYAFAAQDTSSPTFVPRFWRIGVVDYNVLFSRRIVYDKSNPATGQMQSYQNVNDSTVISNMLSNWVDLDDLTNFSIATVDPIGNDPFQPASPGNPFGSAMKAICDKTSGVFYISPGKVMVYRDHSTPTAPYVLSDRPASDPGSIGVREFTMLHSATEMANDALVWGAGQWSDQLVYSRVQDATSIATHGRFQWSDFRTDMSLSSSVTQRADSYVYGSPQSKRGHKDDQVFWKCSTFVPGFVAGMVATIHSNVFGIQDDVPIKSTTITFPNPTTAKFDLELNHDMDEPWGIADWLWPPEPPGSDQTRTETIPIPGIGPIIAGAPGAPPQPGPTFTRSHTIMGGDAYAPFLDSSPPFTRWLYAVSEHHVYTETTCGVGHGAWGYDREWSEVWFEVRVRLTTPDDFSPLDDDFTVATNDSNGRDLWVDEFTGVVKGVPEGTVSIRFLATEPVAAPRGSQGEILHAAEIGGPIIGDPFPSPPDFGRFVTIPGFRIGWGMMATARETADPDYATFWIGIVPEWSVERGYACDIGYTQPSSPTAGFGPYATGEWNSGRGEFGPSATTWVRATYLDPLFLKDPVYEPLMRQFGAEWKTQFPYVPGSLSVYMDGVPLRRGEEFWEVDPDAGIFRISVPMDADGGGSLSVKYTPASQYPADQDDYRYGDPGPYVGNPGAGQTPGGRIYRPGFVTQLGWGSALDAYNCMAAAGAMLLDRSSLGRYQTTPLVIRANQSDQSGGIGIDDIATALTNGWGMSTYRPGSISFAEFEHHINSGRGAVLQGHSAALVPYNLHARSEYTGQPFTGPHGIYVNEQRADGYFFCYDPAFRPNSKYNITPGWYPRAAIVDYVDYSGSPNAVIAIFSKRIW